MNVKTGLVRSGRVEWTLVEGRESPRWLVSIRDELYVVHDPEVAKELVEGALVEYEWEQVGPQKVIVAARPLMRMRAEPVLPDGPVTGASLLAAAMLVAPMELAPTDAIETTARIARKLGAVLGSSNGAVEGPARTRRAAQEVAA